eukprot:gb/GECG01002459.1/.p1 GENE.gb/GECG01002459.1/~~gb/GECG01002459.1/.p1  ORF type:complete len:839 (+),score=49.11 gb/GECG01002459.1/:1-2517(+)
MLKRPRMTHLSDIRRLDTSADPDSSCSRPSLSPAEWSPQTSKQTSARGDDEPSNEAEGRNRGRDSRSPHPRGGRVFFASPPRNALRAGRLFKWELFDTRFNHSDQLASARIGCRKISSLTGMIGVTVVRVTDVRNRNRFTHYWFTDNSTRGLLRIVMYAIGTYVILPILVNLVLTSTPLYELKRPLGTEGFLPFTKQWGWTLQELGNLFFADTVFLSIQTVYLQPGDHYYYKLWPPALQLMLALIFQEMIPRATGSFPVPFAFNFVGSFFNQLMVFYMCYDFATNYLPDYEKGTATPNHVEQCLSWGSATAEFRRNVEHQAQYWSGDTPDPGEEDSREEARRRSYSLASADRHSDYLPSYVVYRRRRILTLVFMMLAYATFYLQCIGFLLLFRLARDKDDMQALLAIAFFILGTTYRKFMLPSLMSCARHGGRFFDGKYRRCLESQSKQFDHRLNAASFRHSDYFYECLSEMFIAFILPEIDSAVVFVILVLGEMLTIFITGGSWIFMLPEWARAREVRGRVTPQRYMERSTRNGKEVSRMPESLVRWTLGNLTGVPSKGSVLYLKKEIFGRGSPRIGVSTETAWSYKGVQIAATSKEKLMWASMRMANKSGVIQPKSIWKRLLNAQNTARIPPHEILPIYLVRMIATSQSSNAPPIRSRRHTIASSKAYLVYSEISKPGSDRRQVYNWRYTDADTEFVLICWVISRCQTLFMMFFANIYASIAFMIMFSFYVFGHNRESFPYVEMCMEDFARVMVFNAVVLGAVLLAIALADIYVRRKIGVSIVSTGLAYLNTPQAVLPTVGLGILEIALIWSFIVDHVYSFRFFIQHFGELSSSCS